MQPFRSLDFNINAVNLSLQPSSSISTLESSYKKLIHSSNFTIYYKLNKFNETANKTLELKSNFVRNNPDVNSTQNTNKFEAITKRSTSDGPQDTLSNSKPNNFKDVRSNSKAKVDAEHQTTSSKLAITNLASQTSHPEAASTEPSSHDDVHLWETQANSEAEKSTISSTSKSFFTTNREEIGKSRLEFERSAPNSTNPDDSGDAGIFKFSTANVGESYQTSSHLSTIHLLQINSTDDLYYDLNNDLKVNAQTNSIFENTNEAIHATTSTFEKDSTYDLAQTSQISDDQYHNLEIIDKKQRVRQKHHLLYDKRRNMQTFRVKSKKAHVSFKTPYRRHKIKVSRAKSHGSATTTTTKNNATGKLIEQVKQNYDEWKSTNQNQTEKSDKLSMPYKSESKSNILQMLNFTSNSFEATDSPILKQGLFTFPKILFRPIKLPNSFADSLNRMMDVDAEHNPFLH